MKAPKVSERAPARRNKSRKAAADIAARRLTEAQSLAANVAGALLRLPAVRLATGYGTSSIYQFVKDGQFPAPRKFRGASLWVRSEIEGWLAAVGRASHPVERGASARKFGREC